jgi:translocation and assembly module TamB
MRRLFTVLKWTFALVVFPILLGAIVLSILVNSTRFHTYLIHTIQEKAAASLGVPAELQNFSLHLSTLGVDLYGITINGADPYPNPPLLQVQHAEASVRIVSVLHRKWYLSSLQIDRPIVQIFVDKNGVSNIPTFKSNNNKSNSTIFDLAIRRAVLDKGEVYYNNRPSSLSADLHNLDVNSTFDASLQKYVGTLSYTDGHLTYSNIQPPPHDLAVTFDATPSTLHLSSTQLRSGNSQLNLTATLNNYSSPSVQANYNLSVDGEQLAQILHNASLPAGMISATGSIQYLQAANRALIKNLGVNGDLTSRQLTVKMSSAQTQVANLVAHYSLENGTAMLRDLRANVLGGELRARGTMKDIGGNSRSEVNAEVRGVSLADTCRLAGPDAVPRDLGLTGALNATASASWGKTLDDLVAHADGAIDAHVSGAQPRPLVNQTQPASFTAQNQTPIASAIPVQSEIHATYFGNGQKLAVDDSYLRTPQTSLTMNGIVSKNSNLNLQLQANDLHEVEQIVNIFRTSTPDHPLQPLGLAGTASFQGIVQGSTSAPHLKGDLKAQNLQIYQSSWKLLQTHVDVSPSQMILQHGDLEPASKGRITFDASTGLTRWTFSNTSPIQLQLNASQLAIADLAKLSEQQIPATGTLDAKIALHGSELHPIGNGLVTLTNATVFDEPVSSAQVTFTGTGDEAHADLSIHAPAGTVRGNVSVHPNEKTYTATLDSSGIHLDKVKSLASSNTDVSGVVTISAKGQGTFDNPQLDATFQIPSLVVQKETISNINLRMNVADHVATADLTSSAVNTTIKGNAKINLTGDYPADATLDTQSIPLGPLLAAYAPGEFENVSGHTEVHATLHGPLKDKQKLEAHVTIPSLNLNYGTAVQLAATAPIHVDYKDQVINVQHSAIRGTDTDLQFEGSIPTAGNAPMSLLLMGNVDLHLAQLFDPDWRTSGQIKFNVNSVGAVNANDIGGNIQIVDANFSSPDLPVGLQHANGVLTLTKERLNISSLQGTVGGGTVAAQGGIVFRPAIRFDMGLAAKGIRMLYPQGMRESMDANLRFTGTTESAVLGGSVSLTELSFTPAFDLTSFIGQFSSGVAPPPTLGFSQNVALNLNVRSASNVNLVSRTLSVGGSANLQVRGTLANPVILGRVLLTGGDIILNGNRFLLTGGTVQLINPSETEPVVNLTLNTTIQQYKITMRFEGPLQQLRTQYTSDPSLPMADVINLLAFGKTTEASAAQATPTNQAAQSVLASQVSSQITSRVSKVAGISQLSINPLLGNSGTSGQTGANITIQQRVTGNLFVTFSTNVATTQGQTIQGQYQVTPRVAVSATTNPNGGFAVDTLIKKSW